MPKRNRASRTLRSRRSEDLVFVGVSLCFLLSGAAGLVYQLVWMRYLATIFGTSEQAIVTVLVAYMGGLAAGAWVAARLLPRLTRPILIYALLEVTIAIGALLVPWLLEVVGRVHVAIMGGQAAPPSDGGVVNSLAGLGLGCIVLLIPTACMGATLPILARGVVRRSEQIGRRTGWLYGMNTLGAVVGVVLAAFFLIPNLGLWGTSYVGVGLNLLVAVIGWFVANRAVPSVERQDHLAHLPVKGAFTHVILSMMLISGSVAFAYEVLWARLLAHVLGGSMYAFATMLAAFLAGIAIGGLLGATVATERRKSCYWLACVQIGMGILTAITFSSIDRWSSATFLREGLAMAGQVTVCGLILMPTTICLGTTFPLAVRSLAEDPYDAGRFAGRVYAWNTIGAIIGAVGVGYFLIPSVGFAFTFRLAISLNLALSSLVLFAMRPVPRRAAIAAAILAAASLFLYQPQPPLRLLTMSPFDGQRLASQGEPELVHHAVGRSATVALLRRQGSYLLRTNGLQEAEIFPQGAASLSYTSIRWLPALPKVLRADCQSLLVVGFGGGTLLEAVPSGIQSIDVIELEHEIIRANELIADHRAIDPLKDTRIRVVINDARGALELTNQCYDAIVSQPSHPWTAGASHLYTREFLELARDHMHEEGIFVQWLGAHFVDEHMFRSFCATMVAVFPHVQLYLLGDNFVFVGSATSLETPFLDGAREDGSLIHLSEYSKIAFVEDVLATLVLDEAGCRRLAANQRPITDDKNLMATEHLPGAKLEGALNEPAVMQRVLGPAHYLNQANPTIVSSLSHRIDFVYLARLLQTKPRNVDLRRFREDILPEVDQLVLQATLALDRDPSEALDRAQAALARVPDHKHARSLVALARSRLVRRDWSASLRGEMPREFSRFIASDAALATAVERLGALERRIVEAEYLAETNQMARLQDLEPELRAFGDHRDPLFQMAARVRLRYLVDVTDKSVQQQTNDKRAAIRLLDDLLGLPLLNSPGQIAQRISLAHHFNDYDYLTATGWILARKLATAPANAPPALKSSFRHLLGEILGPSATKTPDGRWRFSEPALAKFYRELLRQIGAGVLPDELRPLRNRHATGNPLMDRLLPAD